MPFWAKSSTLTGYFQEWKLLPTLSGQEQAMIFQIWQYTMSFNFPSQCGWRFPSWKVAKQSWNVQLTHEWMQFSALLCGMYWAAAIPYTAWICCYSPYSWVGTYTYQANFKKSWRLTICTQGLFNLVFSLIYLIFLMTGEDKKAETLEKCLWIFTK